MFWYSYKSITYTLSHELLDNKQEERRFRFLN
nr:MAG TPA: hypothetical protein [Caudoviricetes sp.]